MLLNEEATAAAIRAAFDRVLVQRTSTVIVFIAAHGYQGYIANYDISLQNPRDKGVPLREVNELIATGLIWGQDDLRICRFLQLRLSPSRLNSSGPRSPEAAAAYLGFAASRIE